MNEFTFELQRFADISNAANDTVITGTANADSINNSGSNVTIEALGGNDTIISEHGAETVNNVINAGDGNDTVLANGQAITVNGGVGNDSITVQKYGYVTVDAGEGDDEIFLEDAYGADGESAYNSSIFGGAGNDNVYGSGNYITVNGGAGDDSIDISGSNNVYIYNDGDDNDNISGFDSTATLVIGDGTGIYSTTSSGDDLILTVGEGQITLGDAAGLETLNIQGSLASAGDTAWATVVNTAGEVSTLYSNSESLSDYQESVGTFQMNDTIGRVLNTNGGDDIVRNNTSYITINGGTGNDTIQNLEGADVIISGGADDDSIDVSTDQNVTIQYALGDGNDTIAGYQSDYGAMNYIIQITDSTYNTVESGDDVIVNVGTDTILLQSALNYDVDIQGTYLENWATIENSSGSTMLSATETVANGSTDNDTITTATIEDDTISRAINGLEGDDSIVNVISNISISGGDGADLITNNVDDEDSVTTISAGAGNDTISKVSTGSIYIQYAEGDGNDVINGFTASDTLFVSSGNYSTTVSGNDVVVTVGESTITLKDTASLDNLNITGTNAIFAESFVTLLQQRTEAGYPVIAGMFFHPEEYHGFDTLPSSYYVESETLTIDSSDGFELTGYHYTPENPNDKWVILVHGYGHNHRHMNGFAMQYLTNNYQVLMIDQRAAGDSEGEWLTMSAGESKDLVLWTHKVAELNPNAKITLHGVSMGAATAMLAAANSELVNVTSLIEDCGYTSVLKLVDIVKSAMPALEDPEVVDLVDKTSGSLTGYTLSEASPIDSIGNATVPSMFITGTSDVVVSMSMLESLYTASGAEVKEIFTVEGATHGVSALTDSIGYSNAVFRFNAEAAGEGWLTSNVTDSITLRGTKYDDTITSSGNDVTINTGEGDDTITNSGTLLLQYNSGDGNDVISSFGSSDTLIIGDGTGTYSTVTSDDDVIVKVGDGAITLQGAANVEQLNIEGEGINPLNIVNDSSDTLITGTAADDSISNSGANVTINALAGNDTITNNDNDKTYIDAGEGDDLIFNNLSYELVTLDSGKEVLNNPYSDTTIVAGTGNDTVLVIGGNNVSITAGEGDDNIFSHHSYYKTIDGGAGNDLVEITEGHYENIYGGDGNDSIIGAILFETVKGDWAMGGYANIDGGAGADYVSVGYSNNATIYGGDDNDTIITYGSNSQIDGGAGNDSIALISNGEETLNSNGTTITGGTGDDTITLDDSNIVLNYSAGDGDDVIIGFTASDTLVISSDTYRTTVSGNDQIVSIVGSQNTITLKDAANIDLKIRGEWYPGNTDLDGTEIENPVATILYDDHTYYYESVARASEDAENNSTVTVIANSTETSAINTTKNLSIQFAESGLGVYNVLSGNFLSYGTIENAAFTFASDRVLSNNGVNNLQIAVGSTATLDNYEITGTSNGYTFSLQNEPFTFNGVSYNGEGTATFDTSGNVTLTSGAIVSDSSLATSDTGIVLTAGEYTINDNTFVTTGTQTIYLDSDGVHFNVSSDTLTYNSMTFSGDGAASIIDGVPTITAGVEVAGAEKTVLYEIGRDTIDSREFWLTEALSDGITVGAIDNGISAAHIVPYEDFPDDAGKTFSEEALIYGDESYTVRINHEGIKSIYGISAGSTIRGTSYLDGEIDTLGSILQFAIDNSGIYTFGDKRYTLNGAIDSVNVVGLTSRFYTDGSGLLKNVYYLNGTISGDFSSAVTINQASMPIQITGDTNVDVYATDSAKAIDDAGKSSISSSGNASVISGVGSGASIISAGGATKVTTDEEGVFVFRSNDDTQQGFTVSGDSSVDFILRNFTDDNGNPTMQVEGVNNFENGYYSFNSDTAYHGINVGDTINASDEYEMVFSNIATFVIADSKVVSVNGIDEYINGLTNDVTVHATGAINVNKVYVNVTGDEDFNVIVTGGATADLVNISAGASIDVVNMNVTTDNNGDFTFEDYVYTIDDTVDGSVTFTTDSKGAVSNISNFAGVMKTSAQNVTVNGSAFTTSNTDVSISSAGTGISEINGLVSGDSISGALDTTAVLIPATTDTDTNRSIVTVNSIGYTLIGDDDGVTLIDNSIYGLNGSAALQIGKAGTYLVNNTTLTTNIGDTIIGTAEGSAYIYDPNNVPLNINTMTDDEIAAQAGISTDYSTVETNTMMTDLLVNTGGAALDGNMALLLDNADSNVAQTADFTNSTGRKRVTLESGDQAVKFNNAGGNVAVISGDSDGEKNVSLGGGGDLVIIEDTSTPVNITSKSNKDTIVTAGGDVFVTMDEGSARVVPNSGNVTLNNYNAANGGGIQTNDYADIEQAILNGYINVGNGAISFGNSAVQFSNEDDSAFTVNLFNNSGVSQKVAYTNSNGGELDASGERANMLIIGNNNGNNSTFIAGSGDDVAYGGEGETFDLGAGNNTLYLDSNRRNSEGATINQTATSGNTQVYGFESGFSETCDKININISAQVSFKDGVISFAYVDATLTLNLDSTSADLAESADLIADNNFVDGVTLDDIAPITYEQGEYMTYATARNTLSSSAVTFAGA